MDFHFASVKEVALVAPAPMPARRGRSAADAVADLAVVVRSALSPPPGARRRAGGHRAPRADARALGRATAGPPPTSASTSPASARSPSPKSSRRPSASPRPTAAGACARDRRARGRDRIAGLTRSDPTEEDDRWLRSFRRGDRVEWSFRGRRVVGRCEGGSRRAPWSTTGWSPRRRTILAIWSGARRRARRRRAGRRPCESFLRLATRATLRAPAGTCRSPRGSPGRGTRPTPGA